jgi:hypothetical protein
MPPGITTATVANLGVEICTQTLRTQRVPRGARSSQLALALAIASLCIDA